jgi:predicted TIM-barrel fold metal-dependent hydrolase
MFPAEMEAPVEDLLATMEEHDIDHAVLVPLSPHDEYLAECLSAFPDRFRGIGVLDPHRAGDGDDARRRFQDVGIRGLRVHHLGDPSTREPETLDAWPGLKVLHELEGVVWLYVNAQELELLPMVLDRLPGLQVMLNHLGWPLPDDFSIDELGRPAVKGPLPPPTLPSVQRLARYSEVHVMFSGEYAFSNRDFPYPDLAETVRAIYDSYGAERMMWASDWPWIKHEPGYKPQLGLVDRYLPGLPPEERAAIMGGTAARLFGW